MQTPMNHNPDTMDTTRSYVHCRHHRTIHQTQTTTQGMMDTIALQTPWNYSPDAMHSTRQHGHHLHCRHQHTIQNTLWTPPDTACTRKPYTGRYIHHKQTWTPCALQRLGNYRTNTMDTTRIHGQCRQQGTLQQTICTSPGIMDTMGNGYRMASISRHFANHHTPSAPC